MAAIPQNKAPTPYETGLNGSLVDFIQADFVAVTEYRAKQAEAQAQIKDSPLYGLKEKQVIKNAALEKVIGWAADKANKAREELQRGARQAFLDGCPEKVQVILSEPEKFLPLGKHLRLKKEDDLVSDTLINLMNSSADPAAVPVLALARVADKKKKTIINRTLYALIANYKNVQFEKVASALLQAGAEVSSISLADAVHRKLPQTVVNMLLDKGASFDEARAVLAVRRSENADRLDFIEKIKMLEENIKDLTDDTAGGRHRAPEQATGKHAAKPAAPRGPA